jgi:hypothetical protein
MTSLMNCSMCRGRGKIYLSLKPEYDVIPCECVADKEMNK